MAKKKKVNVKGEAVNLGRVIPKPSIKSKAKPIAKPKKGNK